MPTFTDEYILAERKPEVCGVSDRQEYEEKRVVTIPRPDGGVMTKNTKEKIGITTPRPDSEVKK